MNLLKITGRVVSGAAVLLGSALGTLVILIENDARRMNRQRAQR